MMNSYNGSATDNWAIDDHNGHFIIRNKATNGVPALVQHQRGLGDQRDDELQRRPDTDWDLVAVDSL